MAAFTNQTAFRTKNYTKGDRLNRKGVTGPARRWLWWLREHRPGPVSGAVCPQASRTSLPRSAQPAWSRAATLGSPPPHQGMYTGHSHGGRQADSHRMATPSGHASSATTSPMPPWHPTSLHWPRNYILENRGEPWAGPQGSLL